MGSNSEYFFGTEAYRTAVEALDLIFRKNEQLSYSDFEQIITVMRAVVHDFPITVPKIQ